MQVQYQMEDLTVGQKVTGTVKAVHDFGVFVDIGAPRDALLNTERFAVSLKGHRLLAAKAYRALRDVHKDMKKSWRHAVPG